MFYCARTNISDSNLRTLRFAISCLCEMPSRNNLCSFLQSMAFPPNKTHQSDVRQQQLQPLTGIYPTMNMMLTGNKHTHCTFSIESYGLRTISIQLIHF